MKKVINFDSSKIDLFMSQHFRDLVHFETVQSDFRDFISDVTCELNSVEKPNLLHSRMNAKKFFAALSANGLLRHNCFCFEIAYNTVLQMFFCLP